MRMLGVGFVALCAGLVAVACGGDDDKPSPSASSGTGGGGSATDVGAGGDAGEAHAGSTVGGTAGSGGATEVTPGGSSTGGSDGEGGSGGEQPSTTAFVSVPSGVELVVDDAAKALGLTLVSSNFTQKASGNQYYKEWFAEVFNGSKETQCFIEVNADFQDAAGGSLQKLHTYADGPSFELGTSVLTTACAAPGDTVPLWSNALDATSVSLAAIKKLSVELTAMARPQAVIHPSTPKLGKPTQTYDAQLHWWTFSGTATAVADITNVKVEFWGKSGGVVFGKSAAFHSADFLEGDSWSFKTLAGIEVATLDSATPYFDFIDGTALARVAYRGEAVELAALRSRVIESRKATEDRLARFR